MIMAKYISGTGNEEYVLNQSYEIMIGSCNPHSSEWTYESVEKKYGINITSFGKDPLEIPITMKYRGTEQQIYQNADNFFAASERDIINMTPGKLYIGDEYVTGYFISHSSAQSSEFYGVQEELNFLSPYPFWIREEKKSFMPITEGLQTDEFLDYEYDYQYDYSAQSGGGVIWQVDHYAPCEFLMTIFGEAADPRITINGHPYQIYTTLLANEYLQIDSRRNAVTKFLANGTRQDLYDMRAKYPNPSVFEPITPGNIAITWPGSYGFDLTLYLERSEPRWKAKNS